VLFVVLVALPGVLLGLAGLAHPLFLTPETAERWRLVHLLLLPVFPLLGASVWLLLLGERGVLAWTARGLAFVYAVGYSALDAIAGLGASNQVQRSAGRGDARPPIEDLFEIGDPVGQAGVVALALAVVLTAIILLQRGAGPLSPIGAAVAVGGSYFLYRHHVFPPRGVLGVLVVAAGLGLMAVAAHRRVPQGSRTN
jgi:hypothetical protein